MPFCMVECKKEQEARIGDTGYSCNHDMAHLEMEKYCGSWRLYVKRQTKL